MGWIYKITNTVNNKIYVGKTTVGISQRWKAHLRDSYRKLSHKSSLYSAMRKYGRDKFTITPIEECDDSILDEREKYWIKTLDTYHNGYNLTRGGDGQNRVGDEDVENVLAMWDKGLTVTKIAKETHLSHSTVSNILHKHGITILQIRSRGGSRGVYADRGSAIHFYDLNGKYLFSFSSLVEASKTLGIHATTLGHVLNGKHPITHGMQIKDYKADRIEPVIPYSNQPSAVHQYTLDGRYVASYRTLTEAGKAMGICDGSSIGKASRKYTLTVHGYQWRRFKLDRIGAFGGWSK